MLRLTLTTSSGTQTYNNISQATANRIINEFSLLNECGLIDGILATVSPMPVC